MLKLEGDLILLITGITGHSGRWFLERLIKEQYSGQIRCLVREDSNVDLLEQTELKIEKVYGNIEDKIVVDKAMRGVDTVVHITSILHSNYIVDKAIEQHVKWVILVHTTGRYSRFKSASEEYIQIEDELLKKRDQIGITVLRPTMIYGSARDRNMYKLVGYLAKYRLFPMFGSGQNLMQPVHAKDLGCAYYDVLVNKDKTFNKEYNLPGKQPIAYIDLIRCVSEVLGRRVFILKIPLWLSILCAKVYNAISKKALISVEQVLRMQEDKAFDYQAASIDFKYSPMSFEKGIVDEVEEYRSSNRKGR